MGESMRERVFASRAANLTMAELQAELLRHQQELQRKCDRIVRDADDVFNLGVVTAALAALEMVK